MLTPKLSTMPNRSRTHSVQMWSWPKIIPMTSSDGLLSVWSVDVYCRFKRLLYCDFIKIALIAFGAALVPVRKTMKYVTVGSVPTVIFILFVMLENSTTLVWILSSFTSSAYTTSDRIIRLLLLSLWYDEPLIKAESYWKGIEGRVWEHQADS